VTTPAMRRPAKRPTDVDGCQDSAPLSWVDPQPAQGRHREKAAVNCHLSVGNSHRRFRATRANRYRPTPTYRRYTTKWIMLFS
jgi:hypothetical protein